MITWRQWVTESANGDSVRQIASNIRVSPSSVSKWMRTGRPPAEAIVRVARFYQADIVVGLVSGGVLVPEDIEQDMPKRLMTVPTAMLVAELSRRAENKKDHFTDTSPPGFLKVIPEP